MKTKFSCLLWLFAQILFTSEEKLIKRKRDLARLKELYSPKFDDEIIGEMYRDTYEYDIHKTSDALREMAEEIDEMNAEEERLEEIERQNKIYEMNAEMARMEMKRQREAEDERKVREVAIFANIVKNEDKSNAEFLIRKMQAEKQQEMSGIRTKRKSFPFTQRNSKNARLLSADLQRSVGKFFADTFDFAAKTEMVSKNWTNFPSANTYNRITPRAGLFENKQTNEIVYKTKANLFNEKQLMEILVRNEDSRDHVGAYAMDVLDKIESRIEEKENGFREVNILETEKHSRAQYVFAIRRAFQERNWNDLFLSMLPGFCPFKENGGITFQDLWEALAEIVTINARLDKHPCYVWARLYDAVEKNNCNLLRILLEHNAKVDSNGLTSLLITASKNSNFDCIAELLKYGADPRFWVNQRRRTENGYTSLHWAASNNRPDIIAILLAYGANIDATNKYGQTPLEVAEHSGSIDALNLLLEFR